MFRNVFRLLLIASLIGMRRSKAPSSNNQVKPFCSIKPISFRPPIIQPSTVNVSQLSTSPVENIAAQKYEVVYAKQSCRKHKKWENDGVLIVKGILISLYSAEGKRIASCSLKAAIASTIEVGIQLKVGGLECELISLLSDTSSSITSPKIVKETKVENKLTVPLQMRNLSRKACAILPKPSNNAFIMPNPPKDHMWRYNPEGHSVTSVYLNGNFAKKLHSYQLEGIKFLYECVLGFRTCGGGGDFGFLCGDPMQAIYGGILADEMGLGKTVQVIGLISMLLKMGPYGGLPVLRRCLIVTPGSLVQNWRKEFSKWVGSENIGVYCVSQDQPIKAYLSQMRPPPVILMSYEMLLQHTDRVAALANLDMVVCDEGHRLKNLGIKTTSALLQLPTYRRLILTGTPVQNDLNELWSLAEFVAPGALASSKEEYRQCIVNPLSQAKKSVNILQTISDLSTSSDLKSSVFNDDDEETSVLEAKRRLSGALRKFLLRRTADVVSRKLPKKCEQIIFCQATEMQNELESILLNWANHQLNHLDGIPMVYGDELNDLDENLEVDEVVIGSGCNGVGILACINAFRKLYNHPSLLLDYLKKYNRRMLDEAIEKKSKSLPQNVVDQLLTVLNRLPATEMSSCTSSICRTSGKMSLLQTFLQNFTSLSLDQKSTTAGCHRLVLISNFTQTLDLLEPICQQITKAPCLRIDGNIPTKKRLSIVERFNSPTCIERVLLLSSKAGGTGLNLIGADFLVLFDMDWNPATDAQAMARIWREGQKRSVHLYRLVTANSLEERIFQRQIAKSSLTQSAMDGCRIFKSASSSTSPCSLTRDELRELFRMAPKDTLCWTHSLLKCRCHMEEEKTRKDNFSSLSSDEDIDDDNRVFQLSGARVAVPKKRAKFDESSTARGQPSTLGAIKSWRHCLSKEAIEALEDTLLPYVPEFVSAVFQCSTEKCELSVE